MPVIEQNANLTASQLLIWLGHQKHPDAPIYNMSAVFRIGKRLDEDAFARALRQTIDESDALRSVFVVEDGAPHRFVLADLPFKLDVIDLRSREAGEESPDDLIKLRIAKPFDVDKCCFDAALIRTGDDEYAWLLVMHHLICDAWATKLIYERVEQHYRREVHGAQTSPQSPGFKDFAAFERVEAETAPGKEAQQYWRTLGDEGAAMPPLSIFGCETSPALSTTKSTRITIELGAKRTAALARLAGEPRYRALNKDLALFQFLSTVLLALLHHASEREALLIGAASANRSSADHRAIIGLLMEIYALKVDVSLDDTLDELFDKSRAASFEFLRHAIPGASGPEIVQASEVLVNFLVLSFPSFDGASVSVHLPHSGASEPHHLLRIQIRDFNDEGSFYIDFDFNHGVYHPHLSQTFADGYLKVLDAFLHDRTKKLKDIELVNEPERTFLLTGQNNTSAAYPNEKSLQSLFQEHAETSPDRLAVIDEGESVSYRTLNARADVLAQRLKTHGVAAGDTIAIIAPPGIGFFTAILAVLKCGGAYAPVNPEWPAQRRTLILERLSPKAVITGEDASFVTEDSAYPVLSLQSEELTVADGLQRIATDGAGIDDIAYVLFTSGSTGEPKGVQCRHRGVINLLLDFEERAPLPDDARVSWWTNTTFDVSVYEVFSALAFGRTLFVPPAHIKSSSKQFYDWLVDNNIDSAYVPPFMLDDFAVFSAEGGAPLSLKRMLVGVEPIPEATLRKLQTAVDELQVVNGYGPTEATICATLYNVPHGPGEARRTPIGKPARNTRVYVLNAYGKPVPFGAPGELYIAGDGLAAGYLGDAALTEEKFLRDPFCEIPGARMYKTGDRVRYLDDGNLEFLGRVDHQIKIRGHRIDPLEIEKALCMQEGVRNALVTVDNESSEKRLVAYIVAGEGAPGNPSQWFERLRTVLPRHMIPSAYVMLDSFPFTPGGKIDRKALPQPPDEQTRQETGWRPQNDQEAVMLKVWQETLGVQPIGGDDHFIDLGGDSMKALQICARLHEEGLKVTPKQVFEAPTICELSALLQRS